MSQLVWYLLMFILTKTKKQETQQHLTRVFQHRQPLHAAMECLVVAEKISSSTAVQDMSKSDHDAVLSMHVHAQFNINSRSRVTDNRSTCNFCTKSEMSSISLCLCKNQMALQTIY